MPLARRQSPSTAVPAADAVNSALINPVGLAAAQAGNDTLDPHDWASVRAQFNLSPDVVHLSNFFLASSPLPVREALTRHRQAFEQNPYTYLEDNMLNQANAAWRNVCEAAADYIGGQAQEVALTTSTTQGLAMIYNGLPLTADDEILTTTHEWYTHDEAMRLAVLKWGGSIRRIDLYQHRAEATAARMVEKLRSAIRPNTRIVAMTWVHSGTGVRLPIQAMADVIAEANQHRSDAQRILLVVDGVHGFGCVDEDVASLGCDFFSAGTHKWILGPHGTGLIWASEDNWKRIIPTIPTIMSGETMEAWRQARAPHGPTQAAWVSPGGFLAFENQWATLEAFQFIKKIGRTRIAQRVAELNGQLKEGLERMPHVTLHTPLDAELSAGIVCCEVNHLTPAEVVKTLKGQNIIINATPYRHSTARFSAGIVNSPEDIDKALEAVRALG